MASSPMTNYQGGNGAGNGGGHDHARIRARMVERLRHHYGIRDERVLAAMSEIPRHLFVPEALRGSAYGDHALPIAAGQTISQPYIVARQTELLELRPDDRVLEIGAGSGYQTAVLARAAQKLLGRLRITNAMVKCFDGTQGWGDFAPYGGILVAAGSPEIPQPLVD